VVDIGFVEMVFSEELNCNAAPSGPKLSLMKDSL